MMKIIDSKKISDVVAKLCLKANYELPQPVFTLLKNSAGKEKGRAKFAMDAIIENIRIAKKEKIPICQDTGMAVVFLKIGQGVHIKGDLNAAVNNGVRCGYMNLRKSIVGSPLFERKNTNSNIPAIIHCDLIPGDKLHITVMPKGFGSENVSCIKMFNPGDEIETIEKFVISTVKEKGANACPPLFVGIGIGGTAEKAMGMAKEVLLKKGTKAQRHKVAKLEQRLLQKINKLGIGPAGLGGRTTVLAVNIETYPTHIAGLPVAINISCWALRYAKAVL